MESFEPIVTQLCSGQEMVYKINQKEIIKNETRQNYGSCALHFQSLPETCMLTLESFESMLTQLRSGQELLYKNHSKGNNSKTERWSYGSCALHFELLPEACIISLESFGPMMTKLCLGQGMLCKNQSKGNN